MRVGIVCPYSLDIPGGVQSHVQDLAEALIVLGHQVSLLAPAASGARGQAAGPGSTAASGRSASGARGQAAGPGSTAASGRSASGARGQAAGPDDTADERGPLPAYVVPAGRSVPVRYNGSVARLTFGPLSAARVRRWLQTGGFDVLHVHEPFTPSLSMLAVWAARGPVVATFHTATTRSRAMAAAQGALQLILERITARIAVSELARKVQVEHLGGGAVEIPNGVAVARYAQAEPLPGWPGQCRSGYGGTVGFLGRFSEPRKGFGVLRDAFVALAERRPGLRLLVAGPGEAADALAAVPAPLRDRVRLLGRVTEPDKRRMLRSLDLYVAPNTGGESFGMILTEAMAAGTPVVATDLDAFRRVLAGAGELFPPGDPAALAAVLERLLDDPARRAELAGRAASVVAEYDWPVLAQRVVEVYESAIEASGAPVVDDESLPEAPPVV